MSFEGQYAFKILNIILPVQLIVLKRCYGTSLFLSVDIPGDLFIKKQLTLTNRTTVKLYGKILYNYKTKRI